MKFAVTTVSCLACLAGSLFLDPPDAQAAEAIMTCTNASSGATWKISIDYAKALVDKAPAQISDDEVTWKELDNQAVSYSLERKTGALTVFTSSSVGGYFLHGSCRAS